MKEHFNWLTWALAQSYFHKNLDSQFNLPKHNNKKWTDGFEWKGLFIRVLPYEDAYFVHNEMQALKYVQTELMELASL